MRVKRWNSCAKKKIIFIHTYKYITNYFKIYQIYFFKLISTKKIFVCHSIVKIWYLKFLQLIVEYNWTNLFLFFTWNYLIKCSYFKASIWRYRLKMVPLCFVELLFSIYEWFKKFQKYATKLHYQLICFFDFRQNN